MMTIEARMESLERAIVALTDALHRNSAPAASAPAASAPAAAAAPAPAFSFSPPAAAPAPAPAAAAQGSLATRLAAVTPPPQAAAPAPVAAPDSMQFRANIRTEAERLVAMPGGVQGLTQLLQSLGVERASEAPEPKLGAVLEGIRGLITSLNATPAPGLV